LGRKITLVGIVLILMAIGVYIIRERMFPGTTQNEDVRVVTPEVLSSPEDAIPEVAGAEAQLFMKVEDTASLSSAISFISHFIEHTRGIPISSIIPQVDWANAGKTVEILDSIKDFVDASDEIALYVTSGDVTAFFASLFVDDEKFDPLAKSDDGHFPQAEERNVGRAGSEVNEWRLNPFGDASNGDLLYAARERIGDNSVVYIVDDEKLLGEMSSAASDPSKRARIVRRTDGSNFIRIKLNDSLDVEGFLLSETEVSWNKTEESVNVQWFSDVYDRIALELASKDFIPKSAPILGEGDLGLFVSLDPAFFIYAMHPNDSDPIKSFLAKYGKKIPAQLVSAIEAILRRCRASAVIVTKGTSISTAYLVIDTAATESVDKLYGIASLFFASSGKLDGWDSTLNVSTGTEVRALVAKKGGTILLGAGDFDEYGKTDVVSRDVERIAFPSNAFGVTVTPRLLKVRDGAVAKVLAGGLAKAMEGVGDFAALKDMVSFEEVDNFNLTHSMGGRIDINILLRK
jgi:hypothetical protein